MCHYFSSEALVESIFTTTIIIPDKEYCQHYSYYNTTTTPYYMTNITFLGLGGERCTTTILPDTDDKDNYHHYSHYYTTNTSRYGTNSTCLLRL